MCPEQAPLLTAGTRTCARHPCPHLHIFFAISEVLSVTLGFPFCLLVTFIDCQVLSRVCTDYWQDDCFLHNQAGGQ